MANVTTINQDAIDNTISIFEGQLIHWVLAAAKQDSFGNWEVAECFLDKASHIRNEIGVLESICPNAEKPLLPGSLECDINEKGIGVWAIESPISGASVGCSVFTVALSQLPPPYGEFTVVEFVTDEFTEVITA